jgi:hypothetical protein
VTSDVLGRRDLVQRAALEPLHHEHVFGTPGLMGLGDTNQLVAADGGLARPSRRSCSAPRSAGRATRGAWG